MSFVNVCLSCFTKRTLLTFQLAFPRNNYAKTTAGSISTAGGAMKKKKGGKMGPMIEKKVLPVETDPDRLVNYVCGSNIFKTGEDIKLKPNEEYPEWLWTIRTGPALRLDELQPDSREYWRKVRKLALRRNNKLKQLQKF